MNCLKCNCTVFMAFDGDFIKCSRCSKLVSTAPPDISAKVAVKKSKADEYKCPPSTHNQQQQARVVASVTKHADEIQRLRLGGVAWKTIISTLGIDGGLTSVCRHYRALFPELEPIMAKGKAGINVGPLRRYRKPSANCIWGKP